MIVKNICLIPSMLLYLDRIYSGFLIVLPPTWIFFNTAWRQAGRQILFIEVNIGSYYSRTKGDNLLQKVSTFLQSSRERDRARQIPRQFVDYRLLDLLSQAFRNILMPLLYILAHLSPPRKRALYVTATPRFAFCLSFFRSSCYTSFDRHLLTTGYFNWIFVETFSPPPYQPLPPRMFLSPILSRFFEHASLDFCAYRPKELYRRID